jgi:repressor LexA
MGRKRQFSKQQVLSHIQHWVLEHGVAPTIKELQGLLDVGSARTVIRYLRWLEEEGDITRWRGARGLRVRRASTTPSLATKSVPIVGQAPAGAPMTAEQNVDGWIRLPQSFLRPSTERFFLLQVRGNSMNRATVEREHPENGDLVLVRQQGTADPGDIVVALIDGEATIKRLVRAAGYWVLKPESTESTHQPIVVAPGFRVQGVVRRVLKKGSEIVNLIEE